MDKKLRVLMVEDNPADADLNAEGLTDAGLLFEYRRIETKEDYLRELEGFKPDIILADYRLPQFDGITALRLAHAQYPFIPFIIVSGVLDEEAAAELFREGASDYVRKGNLARLGPAVKKALELRDAQEAKARAEEELRRSYRELERRVEERTQQLARTNETLCRERGLLQTIFDSIPVMMTIYDPAMQRFQVNKFFVQVTGWTQEDANRDLAEKVYPDPAERAIVLEFMRSLAPGWCDLAMTARDGSKIASAWANVSLPDGRQVGIGLDIRERIQAENALRESEQRYRALYENSLDAVLLTRPDGTILSANPEAQRIFGMTEDEIVKAGRAGLVAHDDREAVFVEARKRDHRARGELGYRRKDGSIFTGETSSGIFTDADGSLKTSMIIRDISERKRYEDTLRRNEYEMRTLVDNSPDLIFRLNRALQYTYANPAYERLTGILRDRLAGRTNGELGMPPDMVDFWREAVEQVVQSGREETAEFEMNSFFGKRYFSVRLIPEFEKSGLVGTVLVIARDISERRKAEEQIRYISFHDEVTGLFNRAFFEEEIRRVDTERNMPVSIIMGDVNNLKLTNDVFGHDEGDALLKAVADSIRKACRQGDIVARWGGDEFAVILPGTDFASAEAVCTRIGEITREHEGMLLRPSVAVGAASKEHRDQNIYQVIRQAEQYMYDFKLAHAEENKEMTLAALLSCIREKTNDYDAHIKRSYDLGRSFGTALGLSEEQCRDLMLLIRLHDIGDVTVPAGVLQKPGKLTGEEWNIVKKHAEAGFRVAKTYADTARISDEILSHAERWDGNGYPRGIKGTDIPYLARILLLIDAFDAMTHPRPYAPALAREEAIEELRRNAGTQFDPGLVDAFIRMLAEQPAITAR